MVQRDYASRRREGTKKKKAKTVNKSLILLITVFIVGVFIAGLFLLKEKSTQIAPVLIPQEKNTPKSVLPSPPEEVWSYIKALETRTVPVDNNPVSLEKNMRLTDEQKKVLIKMEEEQKAAEAMRLKQAAERQTLTQTSKEEIKNTSSVPSKVVEPKKAPETVQKVENRPVEKPATNTNELKFGLQCGAFKNPQQAENIQAKLALAGFNARISTNADWNRVLIGPIGNRVTTQKALEKAKSITNCVLISM